MKLEGLTCGRKVAGGDAMIRKYLAFDIETAKEVPGDDFDWHAHRPLGIACAAALPSDASTPLLWYGKKADGTPAEKMSRQDAGNVVNQLARMVADGYTLVTWNGLAFDLDVLAEESGAGDVCRDLARKHVDLMFHVFCVKGFPVALDKAAQALRIPGKPAGMSGELAPQYWAAGRCQEVLDYVAQDVRTTLQIAQMCDQRRSFRWVTRKGSVSSIHLPDGWLSVDEALRLPEPDTSWMSTSIPRQRFTHWLAGR
jgi:predicted PolB exonuclease-like 3'-5' exonuclease